MIHIMSKTIAKISYLFIFIISLFLISYFLLLHGISIDRLELPKADMKKLYIKLDKKLIVKIDYLKIKKDFSDTNAKSQLLSLRKYLKYFDMIFKELNIKNLQYNNNDIILRYKKDLFFLETNQLYLLANISLSNKNTLIADIKKLYLKPYRVSLIGDLKSNFETKSYEFDGTFFTHNVNGKIKTTLNKNILQYYIYDVKSGNIAPFMDFLNSKIKINETISNWIYKYIVAKDYHLEYIYGKIDIDTGEYYPKEIRAKAVAKDAEVIFHKNLPKVNIKKIDISLKNDILYFKLYDPVYEDIDLNDSYVKITNLLTKNSSIDIVIKAHHPFDNKIKKILEAYNIHIPLSQKGGKTSALLKITIPFNTLKIDTTGYFIIKNSPIYFKNIRFYSKYADIYLHNKTIKIKNSNISYKNLFDLNTTGIFDAKKSFYDGDVLINKLLLKYNDNTILRAKKIKDTINIDFKKGDIVLPKHDCRFKIDKKETLFNISDIKKIYTLSPLLRRYHIKSGSIKIATPDFATFKLYAHIPKYDQKILLKEHKPIKEFNITATINKSGFVASTKDIKLKVSNKIDIETKDISFDFRGEKDSDSNITKPTTLQAQRADIYLDGNITIPTDDFTLFVYQDKKIFSSMYKTNHIFYSKDAKGVDINTNYISSSYLNKLIGKQLFHGGSFKISVKERNSVFKGKCNIVNSVIKSFKKGGEDFKIDVGKFDFYYTNGILSLKNIVLKNDSSTLVGNGYIDIKNKKINLTFKVTILKRLGKTISSIPFLGYILLGKNGKFTSKAKISGTFDNPVITTDFAKNVIKSPFSIIFRIIKSPFELFSPSK